MKADVRYAALAAATRYGAFDAAVRYELLSAEGVIGRFFSSIYLFDVVATSDLAVFGIGKVVQTPATAGDVLTISANISRSDTGQAVDLYTAVLGKPFTDVATCADAAFLLMASPVVDAAALVDSAQLSIGNVSADSATVSDGTTRSVGAAKADSAAVIDSPALSAGKPFTDVAASIDAAFLLIAPSVGDVSTTTDLTLFNVDKQLQDFVFATDDVNGAAVDDDQHIIFFKLLTNVSSVFDTISLLAAFNRAITDSAHVIDSAQLSIGNVSADSATVSDDTTRSVDTPKADSAAVVDFSVLLVDKASDDISTCADAAFLLIAPSVVDAAALVDSTQFSVEKALVDLSAISDVAVRIATTSKADSASAADFSILLVDKLTSDQATAADLTIFNVDKQLQDFVFATDDVNGAAVDDDQHIIFFKSLTNVSSVFDTISLLATFSRAITDSSQVLDVAVLLTAKTLSDGAAVGDTIFISFLLDRDFFDTVLVSTDQADLSISKTTADLATATDSVARVSAYNRILADTTAVADVVSKTSTKPAADIVYLSDVFNVLLTAVRVNIGLVADSGQLLNQDYVDNPLYFADDYVGVKRIF